MVFPTPPDDALLSDCRSGDREAFGVFYVRHRESVLGYLARRVPEPEIAADLMAETFANALVAVLDSRRPLPQAPANWIHTIARNLLIDSFRRGQVDDAARRRLGLQPLLLDDDDIERITETAAAAGAINEAAASLESSEWALLEARVIGEQSYSDLAARLRCSEAVVRKRVSRAKAHLRTALGGNSV